MSVAGEGHWPWTFIVCSDCLTHNTPEVSFVLEVGWGHPPSENQPHKKQSYKSSQLRNRIMLGTLSGQRKSNTWYGLEIREGEGKVG